MTEEYILKNKFWNQRRRAKERNIEWQLTFDQWLSIWEQSGHLAQRGRTKGKYCMSRKGDTGPYSIDNVKIILFEQNNIDQHIYNETKIGKFNSKKVQTPLGIFESRKLASLAHNVNHDTMGYRIKHWPGYNYL
jgi:hypothetical protein